VLPKSPTLRAIKRTAPTEVLGRSADKLASLCFQSMASRQEQEERNRKHCRISGCQSWDSRGAFSPALDHMSWVMWVGKIGNHVTAWAHQ